MKEWIIEFLGESSNTWISSAQNLPKVNEDSGKHKHETCSLEYGLERLKRNMEMRAGPHYRLRNVNTGEIIPMEVFS